MLTSRIRLTAALGAVAALVGVVLLARSQWSAPTRGSSARELWFYQSINLADAAVMPTTTAIWRRAAAAGYSRVVLVDQKFARLDDQAPEYFDRLRELRTLAQQLGLEIVPGVCLVGRGNGGMLTMDPNLAEALPVRDAPFEVQGGIARPISDPAVALAARPDRVDAGITVANGQARMPGGVRGRVAWTIAVAPWRTYHVSVRIAGEDFRGEPRIRVTGSGREIAYATVKAPEGAEPEVRDVVFNSLDNRSVVVWFSLSRDARGELSWSDWRIEESGPVNSIRRDGMAFRFEGLTEGADFAPVRDTLLGMRPWRGQFDAWHEPPAIRVNRPDGTRLRASWWAAGVVLRGQVACCLADSAVLRRLRDEVTRVRELFGARKLFLMHDEIRVVGQDSVCRATERSAAQLVADNVRACRGFAGDARVLVWNDMFDPHHNAVDGYYLARGDLKGAWDGLSRDMVIVNWNAEKTEASLRFFADRGHEQIWAGYYDEPVGTIRQVLPRLDRTPRVTAIMYTTWRNRYDDLEAFARLCRGR